MEFCSIINLLNINSVFGPDDEVKKVHYFIATKWIYDVMICYFVSFFANK